jgi:hypothetical protein
MASTALALKAHQPAQPHSQVSSNHTIGNNVTLNYAEAAGFQGHVSYALPKSLSNDAIMKYEWSTSACNGGGLSLNGTNNLSDLFGTIGHDGS